MGPVRKILLLRTPIPAIVSCPKLSMGRIDVWVLKYLSKTENIFFFFAFFPCFLDCPFEYCLNCSSVSCLECLPSFFWNSSECHCPSQTYLNESIPSCIRKLTDDNKWLGGEGEKKINKTIKIYPLSHMLCE